MPNCVPIKDMRNTAAFTELVEHADSPIIVTKNGYDQFVVMKSADYDELCQAEARAKLMGRIMIAERERIEGASSDAFEALDNIKRRYGL